MRITKLLVLSLLLSTGTAFAAPLVQSGSTVRVVLPEGKKAANALKADKLGWTMKVRATDGMINLVDVTANAAPMKYVISLQDSETPGVVILDNDRFVAGHAYRVELRDSLGGVQTSHVYLVPPKTVNTAKVSFSAADDCAGSDELRVSDKGSL
jgi:hypothetical protein